MLVWRRSLVVPGTSLTIETYLLASMFISVDFPAFGGPMIEILKPSLITSATLACCMYPAIYACISFAFPFSCPKVSLNLGSLSSSASKSI